MIPATRAGFSYTEWAHADHQPGKRESMKKVAKFILERGLVEPIAYVRRQLPPGRNLTINQLGVVGEVIRRAIVESADYAEAEMARALCFPELPALWRHGFAGRPADGLILEFGVWQARSTNFWADLTTETIHGFDSFEGLQEDWTGWGYARGAFSLNGALPRVAPNVRLVKGWFDQTLPGFLASHPGPVSFMHIDCDTYEATSTVLNLAGERIKPGTVVLFDEYFGYRGWRMGEFRAWREFIARTSLQYEYLGFSDQAVAVVVR